MIKNGAQILIESLENKGIEIISGIPGGNILPIYDALGKSKIRHILAKHEQGAAFIAQGMARSSGKIAICMATSGPGAMNLLTALGDAKADSIPIIAITGQVSTSMIGKEAFQEIDICKMAEPVVKKCFFIDNPENIPSVIDEALKIATEGRPGPILIDIPKDIQLIVPNSICNHISNAPFTEIKQPNSDLITNAINLIDSSQKPIILAGNGAIMSHSSDLIMKLANENSIAVATTLHGLGLIPSNHPLNLGMPGMHAPKSTNKLLHEADLILAFGIRFDDRLTGKLEAFCTNAKILHIDISKSEIGKIIKPHMAIQCDVSIALKALLKELIPKKRPQWEMQITHTKRKEGIHTSNPDENSIYPISFLKSIQSIAPKDAIITTDVGQHQMWIAQHYPFMKPGTFLSSGGQGTMGFGLPAAIGASLAFPQRKIITFSGDGSFLMNIQELATMAELKSNITLFIMNNSQLGLVRQQQELFYEKNYSGSIFSKSLDFNLITKGFGIKSFLFGNSNDDISILQEALAFNGPTVINVPICGTKNILPMVPPGAPNTHMIEYKNTTIMIK